mgnify:CR=1 FL=1
MTSIASMPRDADAQVFELLNVSTNSAHFDEDKHPCDEDAGTYYYDADAIREPHVTFTEQSRMRGGRRHFHRRGGTPEHGKNRGNSNLHDGRWDQAFHPKGRNKRTVWSIPLSKFRKAHFAVFQKNSN